MPSSTHAAIQPARTPRLDLGTSVTEVTSRRSRRSRLSSSGSGIDASSVTAVRELLKEVRKLEDEVDSLLDENEDLVHRMNTLMEENEMLRHQLHEQPIASSRVNASSSFPESIRTSGKSTPMNREEAMDDTRRSNASSRRHFEAMHDNSSGDETGGDARAPRKSSAASSRKSFGSAVGFETTDTVMTLPVNNSLRSSRSRLPTPFLTGESVNKILSTNGAPGSNSATNPKPLEPVVANEHKEQQHLMHSSSQVNFERSVLVLEVPTPEEASTEPGHHNRSVRNRIATPFIRDMPQKEEHTEEPALETATDTHQL